MVNVDQADRLDKRGRVQDVVAYNGIVLPWPEISRLASEQSEQVQTSLKSRMINGKGLMNTQLVESLIKVIHALDSDERKLLEEKLFWVTSEPSTEELMQLAQKGGAFDFLHHEPDLYTLADGEPV